MKRLLQLLYPLLLFTHFTGRTKTGRPKANAAVKKAERTVISRYALTVGRCITVFWNVRFLQVHCACL